MKPKDEKTEPKRPYVYEEFPKWKYHKDGRGRIVHSKELEEKLGPDWADAPHYETHPQSPPGLEDLYFGPPAEVPIEEPKKRGPGRPPKGS